MPVISPHKTQFMKRASGNSSLGFDTNNKDDILNEDDMDQEEEVELEKFDKKENKNKN